MKRFRWLLIINLLPFLAQAYSVETHARLTKEIVGFYNEHYSENKVDKNLVDYLVDGSRLEDDPPRWLNHFYDPVKNRGLTTSWGIFTKAKDWAQSGEKQTAFRYVSQIASILSATQKKSLEKNLNYTWQKAIDYWREGKKEMAMNTLGHVLHLLEDMAVPDHTRNDSHPQSSPYEEFSKSAKVDKEILELKNPIELESLNNYFDDLAGYSNNNFYSKDSITDKNYDEPKPDYFRSWKNSKYGFKSDIEFGDYKLIRNNTEFVWVGNLGEIGHELVLSDYWLRLSTKSIQYGAGLIDLFFKKAEQLADETNKTNKTDRTNKSDRAGLLANLVNAITSKASDDGLKEVATVPLDQGKNLPLPEENKTDPTPPRSAEEKIVCSFNTSSAAPTYWILINEVAWMGNPSTGSGQAPSTDSGQASANDEWLELKNPTANAADISGWWLIDKKEDIKVNFPEGAQINPAGFYFLERTDDQTVPFIVADLIYKGSLSNDDEGLRLFDNKCQLVDEVIANPSWPAGNNSDKKTMERDQNLNWHDYSGSGSGGPSASSGQVILGTPKMENSQPLIVSGTGSAGGGVSPASAAPPPAEPIGQINPIGPIGQIKISEFLFDAEGSDDGREFIELYNAGDQEVDLSRWSIQTAAAKKNFESGNIIKPKSFFLVWLGNDERGDMKWASGSLNNTSGVIYLVNNQEKIESDSDPNIVDKISYGKEGPAGLPAEAPLSGAKAGQSWERKALENSNCGPAQGSGEFAGNGCDTDQLTDFDLRATPNPQNTKNLPEPRQGAFPNLRASYDLGAMTITVSWERQTDNSPTSTIVRIGEVNRDYEITVTDSDTEGMSFSTATAIHIPSFLKDLHWFKNSGNETNFIDLFFDNYPFIPGDPLRDFPAFRLVVFYHNDDPEGSPELLNTWDYWQPDGKNLLPIGYPKYYGESGISPQPLILPDIPELTGSGGGAMNDAFNYGFIGNDGLRIKTGADDGYLTLAFYDFSHSGGGNQAFKLKAIEKMKYEFLSQPPANSPPLFSGPIALQFPYEQPDQLLIEWPPATDSDSLDRWLNYEIKINGEVVADQTGRTHIINVEPGKIYDFSVRAHDEFGNFSESQTFQWSYPHSLE